MKYFNEDKLKKQLSLALLLLVYLGILAYLSTYIG
jgi:hypothetical protein